jgi:AT hook motif
MYHEIGIQKLSPAQISRILNGHSVRVKHGSHHALKVSHEHHKKIMSAHRRGAGVNLMLDPYAIQLNQHLRGHKQHLHKSHGEGEGFKFDDAHMRPLMRSIGNVINPLALAGLGEGVRKRGRPRKHHAVHHKSHGEGDGFRRRTHKGKGSLEDVVGKMNPLYWGYELGHDVIAPALMGHGEGEGIRRRGRPRKSGALLPAGYSEGEGIHRKKRGRPRKHALKAKGEGKRGRVGKRGKGTFGSMLGSLAGNFLPF